MAGINLIPQLKKPRGETVAGTFESGSAEGDGGGGLFAKLRASLNFGRSADAVEADAGEGFTQEDRMYLLRFLLGLGLIFGGRMWVENYTQRLQGELQAQADERQRELDSETAKLKSLQSVKTELDDYERQMNELRTKLDLIKGLSRNRNLLVRAVDYAVTEMPESLWLRSVDITLGNEARIELSGYAITNQIISEYVKRLEGSVFFPAWNLIETVSEDAPGRPNSGVVVPDTGSATTSAAASGKPPSIEAKRFSMNAKVVPL